MNRLGRGIVLAVAALGASLAIVAGSAAQDEETRCHGRVATFVGTAGVDNIRGTSSRDVIWAGPGDDRVHASLGNDLVCGGSGADLLHGGRGNDVADGGGGDRDQVIGDLGDDELMGGPGEFDEVAGSLGIDTINGGSGSFDLVHGDYGYDRMDGGPGNGDVASFATKVAGGRGAGVWVSLAKHKARGDGHDRLYRLESIEGSAFADHLVGSKGNNAIDGGPGNDTMHGGGGVDQLDGGQGDDACFGAKGSSRSCGPEAALKASAYVQIDAALGGGGGLAIVGGDGNDEFTAITFDEVSGTFGIAATKGIALGPGCDRPVDDPKQAVCDPRGPARWLMADLGPGDDKLRVEGSLVEAENIRLAGGLGDDVIRGGPEDDLIEAGPGSDRIHGGAGADGLIGGLPGPTSIYGEEHGDLMAAGGGCAGGEIVGGPGRDDASFAETQAHPGLLYISFPLNRAWVDVVRGCDSVRLDDSNEDMEGSFDNDVLIGDSGKNAMLGQPGQDRYYGNGGDDVIDARDGVRDFYIQCARKGGSAGRALIDSFDPPTEACAIRKHGEPVKGLNNSG